MTLSFYNTCFAILNDIDTNEPSCENQRLAYAKTKAQISFAVTAKLISAFVFATGTEQFFYFLNPKCPATSHLL